jgi:hypothetical protein
MRRILICTGVLGGGSALVFAAAAVTSVLIPPGRIVPQGQSIMIDQVMPARLGGPVRALTTDQAVGPDVFVELRAPEKVP